MKNNTKLCKHCISEPIMNSIVIFEKILENDSLIDTIYQITKICIQAYQKDKKLLFCGNGGSAADAQHIAAELSGKFYIDRRPLNAEALHVNSSFITAVANDYGFDKTYSRMIEAIGEKDDVLFGISTSGNSPNVLNALEKAKSLGITTIGLTGQDGGKMNNFCDFIIQIPSIDTPRIQESHILIGHILCQLIEQELFS